jgi:hypothetical protein
MLSKARSMRIDDKGIIWIDVDLPVPESVPLKIQGLLNCSRRTREVDLMAYMELQRLSDSQER